VLVALAERGNFLVTWAVLTGLALASVVVMSGALFWRYYANPTFASWQRKSNPAYPPVDLVRREVLQTLKGVYTATLCPAVALHIGSWSKAYGGLGGYGVGWLVASFFVVWIGSDLYEFAYHRLGHTTRFWWRQHKGHHVFFNPSPFSVIADDHVDQLIRSAPLLLFPLVMPVNMDLLFATYGVFFYAYGVYLHQGFEPAWPSAHHPLINTAFQHYVHHAKSTLHRPLHTGFFFKLWDQLAGSVYDEGPETCLCAGCAVARGERTRAAYDAVDKPDYAPLLSPAFWWTGRTVERS
jgi:lathosterol oxidase